MNTSDIDSLDGPALVSAVAKHLGWRHYPPAPWLADRRRHVDCWASVDGEHDKAAAREALKRVAVNEKEQT